MPRVIEKEDGTITFVVHLSLKPGRDDALIQLVQSAPKRGLAGFIREAMHTDIHENQINNFEENEDLLVLPDLGIDL